VSETVADVGDHQSVRVTEVEPERLEVNEAKCNTRGGDNVAEMLDRDFAFALDLLVAGIEAMAERG
jgi:hypothetical protein